MDALKEPKEEPLFDNYVPDEKDIKEEEISEDESEKSFALSSAPQSPERSRSVAPEPKEVKEVKEEDIDEYDVPKIDGTGGQDQLKNLVESQGEKEKAIDRTEETPEDCPKAEKSEGERRQTRKPLRYLEEPDEYVKTPVKRSTPMKINAKQAMFSGLTLSSVLSHAKLDRTPMNQVIKSEKTENSGMEDGARDNSLNELPSNSAIQGEGGQELLENDRNKGEGEKNMTTIDHSSDTPKESSKTGESERKRKCSTMISNPLSFGGSEDEFDGDYEIPAKRSLNRNTKRTSSNNRGISMQGLEDGKETPQCIHCEKHPKTPLGYVNHMHHAHDKSTLISNGIYLLCECGQILTSLSRTTMIEHNAKCHGRPFTIKKIGDDAMVSDDEINNGDTSLQNQSLEIATPHSKNEKGDQQPLTPQCVHCDEYPITPHAYVMHLSRIHNQRLATNGIFLLCACGHKDTSYRSTLITDHHKNCQVRQFTLHKIDKE